MRCFTFAGLVRRGRQPAVSISSAIQFQLPTLSKATGEPWGKWEKNEEIAPGWWSTRARFARIHPHLGPPVGSNACENRNPQKDVAWQASSTGATGLSRARIARRAALLYYQIVGADRGRPPSREGKGTENRVVVDPN